MWCCKVHFLSAQKAGVTRPKYWSQKTNGRCADMRRFDGRAHILFPHRWNLFAKKNSNLSKEIREKNILSATALLRIPIPILISVCGQHAVRVRHENASEGNSAIAPSHENWRQTSLFAQMRNSVQVVHFVRCRFLDSITRSRHSAVGERLSSLITANRRLIQLRVDW